MTEEDGKRFGALAERLAARRLRGLGYRILASNVRLRGGELDLVAKQGEILVFCEIKARRATGSGEPGEAVDARKRNKLARLAMEYLGSRPDLAHLECRFDVVLLWRSGLWWRVEVIADAFRPGWE
ncbi:MAG: YraN family protein [Magnetococcales bacterium]|nr:YraN family protein [Magnetococcales bacterium]